MKENTIWIANGTFTRLRIRVKTKSGKFKIENQDDEMVIHVKSPPEKGKANQEIIKGLAKKIGISSSKIRIISGHTSTNKIIEIEYSIDKVLEALT